MIRGGVHIMTELETLKWLYKILDGIPYKYLKDLGMTPEDYYNVEEELSGMVRDATTREKFLHGIEWEKLDYAKFL